MGGANDHACGCGIVGLDGISGGIVGGMPAGSFGSGILLGAGEGTPTGSGPGVSAGRGGWLGAGIRRGWVWVGLIREWNARHGRPPKWVAGQSERSTLPRNGGGFVGLLLCPLPRFPRNLRISEDRDQSRGLLAGATSDAKPFHRYP